MTRDIPSGFCRDVEVREASGKGLGIFAKEPVKAGDIVWRFQPGNFEVYAEPGFLALLEGKSRDEVVYELTHCFAFEDFPDLMIRILDQGVLINHDDAANVATNFQVELTNSPDPASPGYLADVRDALLQDRFSLIATRDIRIGEEFTNNYGRDVFDPPYYLRLCEMYGVDEDYLC